MQEWAICVMLHLYHPRVLEEQSVRYKILIQKAGSPFKTDFERAAQMLADQVNEALREGWQVQGGLATGRTTTAEIVYLMQAVVKPE